MGEKIYIFFDVWIYFKLLVIFLFYAFELSEIG